MKHFILTIFLFLGQTMFSQKGFEVQIYQGVTDNFSRQKIKVMTTYEHFKGRSHLGLDFERFSVGGYSDPQGSKHGEYVKYSAVGGFVEFGYAFTNFKPPIEIMPLASLGWFLYDTNRWGQRLLFGLDTAYILNYNIKLHLLVNFSGEHWMVDNEIYISGIKMHNYEKHVQNGNNIFIGISYNP